MAGRAANFDASSSARHDLGSDTHCEAGEEGRVEGTRAQDWASTSAFEEYKEPSPEGHSYKNQWKVVGPSWVLP